MCLTWARLHQSARRMRRLAATQEDALAGEAWDQDPEQDGEEVEGNSSVKRKYQALVMSGVIGYLQPS